MPRTPLPTAVVSRGGGNLLHRTLGRRADPGRRLMRNLAAALCLFVFSAQAASASLMAGRIVGVRGVDRIVRIDWQYPWQLPRRFRNHCAYEVFNGASLLFQLLRQRLSILVLLGSLVRLLSCRSRLL